MALKPEELARHEALIRAYSQEICGCAEPDFAFYRHGIEKGVWTVRIGSGGVAAAAAARDKDRELFTEYHQLHHLFDSTQEPGRTPWFPRPIFHYKAQGLGELIVMELLPHIRLDEFRREHRPRGFQRNLAYELGYSLADVWAFTGTYSAEPHDGNILARPTDDEKGFEIRFCDAIQFKEGDYTDAIRSFLAQDRVRPECYRFIHLFRQGITDRLKKIGTNGSKMTEESIHGVIDPILREYNDIF